MEVVVKNNQSIFDIAVEHMGDVDAVINLAFTNDISMTDALEAASSLDYFAEIIDDKVATLYGNLHNKPATAISRAEIRELCDSVGSNTADFGTFTYVYDDTFYRSETIEGSAEYYALWNQSVIKYAPTKTVYSNITLNGCSIYSGGYKDFMITIPSGTEGSVVFDLEFAPVTGHKYLVLASANLALNYFYMALGGKDATTSDLTRHNESAYFGSVITATAATKSAAIKWVELPQTFVPAIYNMYVVDITLAFNSKYDDATTATIIEKVIGILSNTVQLDMLTEGQQRSVGYPAYVR